MFVESLCCVVVATAWTVLLPVLVSVVGVVLGHLVLRRFAASVEGPSGCHGRKSHGWTGIRRAILSSKIHYLYPQQPLGFQEGNSLC